MWWCRWWWWWWLGLLIGGGDQVMYYSSSSLFLNVVVVLLLLLLLWVGRRLFIFYFNQWIATRHVLLLLFCCPTESVKLYFKKRNLSIDPCLIVHLPVNCLWWWWWWWWWSMNVGERWMLMLNVCCLYRPGESAKQLLRNDCEVLLLLLLHVWIIMDGWMDVTMWCWLWWRWWSADWLLHYSRRLDWIDK